MYKDVITSTLDAKFCSGINNFYGRLVCSEAAPGIPSGSWLAKCSPISFQDGFLQA